MGQNFEQEVVVPLDAGEDLVEMLVERFHRQHEAMYGYRLAGAVVEFVHFNATAIDRRAPSALVRARTGRGRPDRRAACLVRDGGLGRDADLSGGSRLGGIVT